MRGQPETLLRRLNQLDQTGEEMSESSRRPPENLTNVNGDAVTQFRTPSAFAITFFEGPRRFHEIPQGCAGIAVTHLVH